MPYKVEILKGRAGEIRYPSRCVACGSKNPDSVAHVRTWSSAWKPLNEDLLKSYEGAFPACAPCVRRVSWGRILDTILTWVFVGLFAAVLLPTYSYFGDRLGDVGGILLLVVGLSLTLLAKSRVFVPLADCTGWDERLVFSFRDKAYAEEFAVLNGVQAEDTPVA